MQPGKNFKETARLLSFLDKKRRRTVSNLIDKFPDKTLKSLSYTYAEFQLFWDLSTQTEHTDERRPK